MAESLGRRDGDAFVDLVDGGVDRADLDHLRADVGDEAAVRGAAGGRQFGFDAGFADGRSEASTSAPRPVRKGLAPSVQAMS
jgi:hypothetical protein